MGQLRSSAYNYSLSTEHIQTEGTVERDIDIKKLIWKDMCKACWNWVQSEQILKQRGYRYWGSHTTGFSSHSKHTHKKKTCTSLLGDARQWYPHTREIHSLRLKHQSLWPSYRMWFLCEIWIYKQREMELALRAHLN